MTRAGGLGGLFRRGRGFDGGILGVGFLGVRLDPAGGFPGFLAWFDRGFFLGEGEKRLNKGFLKAVDFGEVFQSVGLAFAKDAVVDQIKDNLAEIFTALDTPIIQHKFAHGSEFPQGMVFHAFQEFRSGDMARGGAVAAFEGFEGVIKTLTNEAIGGGLIAGIVFDDLEDNLIEVVFLHKQLLVNLLRWLGPGRLTSDHGQGSSDQEKGK